MKAFLCLLLFAACMAVIPAQAATYWVATNGNDSFAGTFAAPWLTRQKAANSMVAGDTAIITQGIYTDTFYSSAHGTAASPITFQGTNLPVIVRDLNLDHSYHVIRGFDLTNVLVAVTATNASFYSNVVRRFVQSHLDFGNRPIGTIIHSNVFLNPARNCATFQGTGHLISTNHWEKTSALVPETDADGDMWVIAASNSRFVGNYVTNWANPAPANPSVHTDLIQSFSNNGEIATNNVIERNIFLNCTPQVQFGNITDDGSAGRISNWTWRNNIWANIGAQMSLTAPDFKFYNNTFYRVGTESGGFCLFRTNSPSQGAAHNGQMFNNIFVECGTATNPGHGWWGFVGAPTNFQSGGNLVVGTGAGTTKTGFTNGINGSDPLLVSAATLNFHIATNSPAVGAATNFNSLFTQDFDLVTRGSLWDAGAFEATTNAPDTTPPLISSATVSDNGTTWTLAFNEAVTYGAGGSGGFTATLSGGSVTLTYFSGAGTSTITWTGSRTVQSGETGTLAFTQPGNGVEDTSGNDLATFSGQAVVNNSTQGGGSPAPSPARFSPKFLNLRVFGP